ncbi:MAG: hypothetical protein IJ558_06925 [Treponema sp.]|nr:hypothetical protein [Treponema sp.]
MTKHLLILTALYLLFAIPLSVIDWRKFRVSAVFPLIALAALFVARLLLSKTLLPVLQMTALSLATSLLLFFCVEVFTGDWLGFDDICFGACTAVYCGFYDNLVAAAFAALIGVLFYLSSAAMQKLKKNTVVFRPVFAIPIMPFVTSGAVLTKLLFYVIA